MLCKIRKWADFCWRCRTFRASINSQNRRECCSSPWVKPPKQASHNPWPARPAGTLLWNLPVCYVLLFIDTEYLHFFIKNLFLLMFITATDLNSVSLCSSVWCCCKPPSSAKQCNWPCDLKLPPSPTALHPAKQLASEVHVLHVPESSASGPECMMSVPVGFQYMSIYNKCDYFYHKIQIHYVLSSNVTLN